MGINLCIYDENQNEHPTWDFVRHAGDKEVVALMCASDYETSYDYFRPINPGLLLEKMIEIEPDNAERWEELCNILSDKNWWVYICV